MSLSFSPHGLRSWLGLQSSSSSCTEQALRKRDLPVTAIELPPQSQILGPLRREEPQKFVATSAGLLLRTGALHSCTSHGVLYELSKYDLCGFNSAFNKSSFHLTVLFAL